MTNFDENYIDRYLFNELTDEEKKVMEDKLKVDKMLRDKVNNQMNIMQISQIIARQDVKRQITSVTKSWEQYVPELQKSTVFEKRTELNINMEAIIEGLLTVFNQFFRPYSVSFRKASINHLSIEAKAFALYKKEKYQQAIALLKQLPAENMEAKLMMGNALLITQKYEQALPQFTAIIEQKPIGYTSEAQWYAGLTLLNLNRLEEAKLYFEEVTTNKYAEKKIKNKAAEVLEQIKEIQN